MSWCLSQEEDNIFLMINEKRAVDSRSELFPEVSDICCGRNADELWIKFSSGNGGGRRLSRTKFKASTQFSGELSNSSNTAFINSFYEKSNRMRKTQIGTKRKAESSNATVSSKKMPNIEPEAVDDHQTDLGNKFKGQFVIDATKILHAPVCRKIKPQWVQNIKQNIMADDLQMVTTTISVMVDSSIITDVNDFDKTMINEYNYLCLGGNHLTTAIQHLIKENSEKFDNLRQINAYVFVGLTQDECQIIGNKHNFKSKTMNLTFQDKVFQARLMGGENLNKRLHEALSCYGQEEVSKDSLSTIINVARYNEENFQEFENIVSDFEAENGVEKCIPQVVFKLLQGMSQEYVKGALQRVRVEGLKSTAKWIKSQKNLSNLQEVFRRETDCESIEQAKQIFPSEFKKIKDFTDIPMKRKYVPKAFLEFCSAARDPISSINNKIEVKISGLMNKENLQKSITATNIFKKYCNIIVKELKCQEFKINEELEEITTIPETQSESQLSTQCPYSFES